MRRPTWLATGMLLACCTAVFLVHGRIEIKSRAELGEPFVPRPEVARLSSFGFRTALSDFYWLAAVQVVGRSMNPESEATLLGRFIDVVTTLDPWVGHPYRFAAVWLNGSEEQVRHANTLLRRSLPYHPDEWRNRFYLGFNHFYYLEESQEAAYWMEEAARMPGSPRYLIGLAARLRAGEAGLDVAEGLIQEMLDRSEDPYAKAGYEKMLDEIRTERLARMLDRAREKYRARFERDIEAVADLTKGPDPVLRSLPPEPHDWEWTLDEETGEIVSSWYGHRYRPHADPEERAAREGWRVKKDAAGASAGGEES